MFTNLPQKEKRKKKEKKYIYIKKISQKSETRMTASVLKQGLNTQKVQKNPIYYRTKHNMKIFKVIPFDKLRISK